MNSESQKLAHNSKSNNNKSPQEAASGNSRSSLRLDKIACNDGDAFCFYYGKSEATKTKVRINCDITADDYDALLDKGFFSCGGGFERYEQTSGSIVYPIRALANQFRVLRKKKHEFTKFSSFLDGKRGVLPKTTNKAKSEADELILINSEEERSGFNLTKKLLEKIKQLLITKLEDGSLYILFVEVLQQKMSVSDCKMSGGFEENKKFPVSTIKNNILMSTYFTSQYYMNRQKMSKAGLADDYPSLEEFGEGLKESFEALVKEWKEKDFEKFGLIPSSLNLIFKPNKASFSFEINQAFLGEETNHLDLVENHREESHQRDTNQSTTAGSSDQDTEEVSITKLGQPLQNSTKMSEYKLVKKKHPLRGPPKEEWFISKAFDLYEAKKRKFTTNLVKASYTTQKYELFNRYNSEVHGKTDPTPHSFFKANFCRNEIQEEVLVSPLDPSKTLKLGSFHLELYLDGTLIGVDYIKIVKSGIVQSYYFYEPSLKPLNLRNTTFLESVKFIQEKTKFFKSFKYAYLGFYIHKNPKFNYKTKYRPIELRCPIKNTWVRWSASIAKRLEEGATQLTIETSSPVQSRTKKKTAHLDDQFNRDLHGYIAQLESIQDVYSEMKKKGKKKTEKEREQGYPRREGGSQTQQYQLQTKFRVPGARSEGKAQLLQS